MEKRTLSFEEHPYSWHINPQTRLHSEKTRSLREYISVNEEKTAFLSNCKMILISEKHRKTNFPNKISNIPVSSHGIYSGWNLGKENRLFRETRLGVWSYPATAGDFPLKTPPRNYEMRGFLIGEVFIGRRFGAQKWPRWKSIRARAHIKV